MVSREEMSRNFENLSYRMNKGRQVLVDTFLKNRKTTGVAMSILLLIIVGGSITGHMVMTGKNIMMTIWIGGRLLRKINRECREKMRNYDSVTGLGPLLVPYTLPFW